MKTQITAVVGDLHSCYDEVVDLVFGKLGFVEKIPIDNPCYRGLPPELVQPIFYHPENHKLIFAGDLMDRGPEAARTIDLVMDLCAQGVAQCVLGNHDSKMLRYLKGEMTAEGSTVKISHGLRESIDQLDERGGLFKKKVYDFLASLPTYIETDDFIVCHGAWRDGVSPKQLKELNLYGDVDKKAAYREDGFPNRLNNWKSEYLGNKNWIVVGHIVTPEPEIIVSPSGCRVISIDQGCCFGGSLTAVRLPSEEIFQVKAYQVYYQSKKIGV